MADEAPFQFLHQQLIQYIYKSNGQGEVRFLLNMSREYQTMSDHKFSFTQESGRNITNLENLGFRVGQGLIER